MCEMGDLFEYNKQMCSSSSSLAQPASAPDEISLFLQQILVRSSSAAAEPTGVRVSNALPDNLRGLYRSQVVGDGILDVDSSGGYLGKNMSGCGLNVPSSLLGVSENENENEEYDCESEEGLEAFAEEVPAKSVVGRSSSKRSRAAEVHNLSEKRRRSRINEKMKALQNLIPNSNKTDKASMLDEAIEYLKQLQLQVQMLAMRNGLSLHPMCLPGELQSIQLPQSRMDFGAENLPLHQNMMDTLHFNQETSPHNLFTLPKQPAASNQLPVPNMLDIINSESAFGLDSSIQAHLGVFQLQKSSQEICNEDGLQHQQTNINHSQTNPLEFEMRATTRLAFNAQASEIKGSDALETCIVGRERSEDALLNAIEQSLLHPSPSHLNSMRIGRSTPNNDIKSERSNV